MCRVLLHTNDCFSPTFAFPVCLDGFGSTPLEIFQPVEANGPVTQTGRCFVRSAHGSFLALDAIGNEGVSSLASASAEEGRLIRFRMRNAVAEPATPAVSTAQQGELDLARRPRVGRRSGKTVLAIDPRSRAFASCVSDPI
ncbi:hypothetical protein Sinac_7285 [Singulisphaera acidiphila DSM 18658]|uniref:Uncharacterized protein n=1 Tax=Singulisphaera acidiphila (strain ATCC BAA-1392 / DSM 18658 / VKM B-2454 / MOB10) TaxID=886293 RepID=L0DPZ5_SINAD|nr:hypothetical protein Sinac_7285 [Singulisphaera acidiphila DSM 18658]